MVPDNFDKLFCPFPFDNPTKYFAISRRIIPFALSTSLLDCGCLTEAKCMFVPT
jgi:hypothetical protein